jgi:hypothetical protein
MKIIKKISPNDQDELFITLLPENEGGEVEEDLANSLPCYLENSGYKVIPHKEIRDICGFTSVFKRGEGLVIVEHDEQIFLTITVKGRSEWNPFFKTLLNYCEKKLGPIPPSKVEDR